MPRSRTIAAAAITLLGLAVPIAASASTPPTPPPGDPTMDPDGLVDAAVAGYGEFVASYGDTEGDEITLVDCPILTVDEIVALVAPIGDASQLSSVLVSALVVEEYSDAEGVEDSSALVPIVSCDTEDAEDVGEIPSGDFAGIGIGVFDFANSPDGLQGVVDFVSDAEIGEERAASAETFGGIVYGACHPDEESEPTGLMACYQFWIRDTFSVGAYVIVEEASATDAVAALGDALVAALPGLLQGLADGVPPVDVVSDDDDSDPPCSDDAEAPGCAPPTQTS